MPGFDGSGRLFERLIHKLEGKADCTPISYTRRNSLEELVADVEKQIPLEEPVSLVAESFSGPIAVELIARAERNYGPSVLSATFAKPPWFGLMRHLSTFPITLPGLFIDGLVRAFCLNGCRDEGLIQEVRAVVQGLSPELIRSRMLALATFDVEERLPKVRVPVLLISAARDRLVKSRNMAPLLRSLFSVSAIELEGPHLILQANPEDAASAILHHIDA